MSQYVFCPYANCGYTGTDDQVDEHRVTGIHNDEPQAGSNLTERPHWTRIGTMSDVMDKFGVDMGEAWKLVLTSSNLAANHEDHPTTWTIWERT